MFRQTPNPNRQPINHVTIRDLTDGGDLSTFPNYPEGGLWKVSRERDSQVFPILGSKPVVHFGGVQPKKISLPLVFTSPKALSIYQNVILPSYGTENEAPHLMLLSWGKSSGDTFTGRPISLESHDVTRVNGGIVHAQLEYTLTEDSRERTRLVNNQGKVISGKNRVHTVIGMQSLASISALYNVTIDALALLNNNPPWYPKSGTTLFIP